MSTDDLLEKNDEKGEEFFLEPWRMFLQGTKKSLTVVDRSHLGRETERETTTPVYVVELVIHSLSTRVPNKEVESSSHTWGMAMRDVKERAEGR